MKGAGSAKRSTRLVRNGRPKGGHPGTINLPVARASTVTFASVAEMDEVQRRFNADEAIPTYAIAHMPLRVAFEELMVELEGGHRAFTFPTGLAAVGGAILAAVGAGDHILVTDSCYGPTRRLCDRTLKRFGVETTYYDPLLGEGIAEGDRIFNLAALAVFCSIIAHGLTDTPGSEWLAQRAETNPDASR